MEARYTYRLRVNEAQARSLQEVFDSCRFVWNTALGRWSDLWRHEEIRMGFADMSRELTDWRSRFDWLAAVPVTPQQQVLRDLDKSIRAFYDKDNPGRRPRFKRKRSHATACWNHNGFALDAGRLSVAVAGGRTHLRVVWSRPLPSAPRSVTVYRDILDWQARKAGHEVIRLDPRNTTQTCSACGAKAKHRLGLADRIFAVFGMRPGRRPGPQRGEEPEPKPAGQTRCGR